MLSADPTSSQSIALQWTSSGAENVGYEIHLARDTSFGCPNEHQRDVFINDGSTAVEVEGLEADSRYSITVTGFNPGSSETSNTVTEVTLEEGERLNKPFMIHIALCESYIKSTQIVK